MHLAKYARHVTLVTRGDGLSDTMSRYLVSFLENADRVSMRPRTIVVDGDGDTRLRQLTLRGARQRRAGGRAGGRAVRHDRRRPAHRAGCRTRSPATTSGYLLTGPDVVGAGPAAAVAARASAARARDQPARRVRRRRRARRLGQAGGVGGRRGSRRRAARAAAPGGRTGCAGPPDLAARVPAAVDPTRVAVGGLPIHREVGGLKLSEFLSSGSAPHDRRTHPPTAEAAPRPTLRSTRRRWTRRPMCRAVSAWRSSSSRRRSS